VSLDITTSVRPAELEVDVLGRWVDSDSGLEEVVCDSVDSVGGSFVGQLREEVLGCRVSSNSAEHDTATECQMCLGS
jgi:hypothetical protein